MQGRGAPDIRGPASQGQRPRQSMLKRFFKSPLGQRLLGELASSYVLLARYTSRWEYVHRERIAAIQASQAGAIICFWHNRMLGMPTGWPQAHRLRQRLAVLVSRSRDGDLSAATCASVGYSVIRGSSAKQGKEKGVIAAWREMMSHIAKGGAVAISPDGPRGPRMRAQAGAVHLAKRTGAPIICYAWSQRGRRTLDRSWDRQLLPKVFGRGVVLWSEPMHVPRDADDAAIEAARVRLEDTLTALADEADRRVGAAPIPAAVLEAEPEPA